MPTVGVNDIKTYYEIHGEGDPLIFIAGLSADHTVYQEIAQHFTDNYQVILFDNRGVGQSDVPLGPYSIEQFADDIALLMGKLSIKKAHFFGNSMGGFILQTLAYRMPHLVRSAIISNSPMSRESSFQYFVQAMSELLHAEVPKAAISKAFFSWIFSYRFLSQPGVLDALIALSINNPYPITSTGFDGQCGALLNFCSRPWAGQISVPSLVLGADQDLIFRESLTKALADAIPHAEYYCFKECGHLPFIEYPEHFTAVVKEFLAKN